MSRTFGPGNESTADWPPKFHHGIGPAVAAVGGLVAVLHVVVVGLALLAGNEVSVGLFAYQRSSPTTYSLLGLAVSSVNYYLFVGPAEELAFRGYLQNKLLVLLDGRNDRVRTAFAVTTAAVVFSLLHLPVILVVGGFELQGMVGALLSSALSGIAFGIIYESTRNLYLVAFLHGIGDWSPLFVDPGPDVWPNWVVVSVSYTLLVLSYRQWAVRMENSNWTSAVDGPA